MTSAELANAIYKGENKWIESITIQGGSESRVRTALKNDASIDTVELRPFGPTSNTYQFIGFVTEEKPFLLTSLSRNDAVPYRLLATDDRVRIVAIVDDWDHLKNLAGHLESDFEAIELIETSSTESLGSPLGLDSLRNAVQGRLTEKQLELIETAYQKGYCKVPQEAKSKDVAAALDITQPTFSEQFRQAEDEIFSLLFADSSDESGP